MQQDEIILDGPLLNRAFRRQLRLWLPLGLLLFGLLLLLALCLVPRSYTASASVAIQQPSGSGSALSLLAGGGGGASKRYIGVLKSREMAEAVERRVGLRQLYGGPGGRFRKEADAVEFLTKSIKPDDNAADGLLYVGVTLPGQPKLSLHQSPSEAQIKAAAALAANSYVLALKQYYLVTDTDQGSVLLRGVDEAKRQARADYERAQRDLLNFNRALGGTDMRGGSAFAAGGRALSSSAGTASPGLVSAGALPTAGADSATPVASLAALEAQLSQVQADLRTAQATRQAGDARTAQQLQNLPSLPTDDPQLADIRARVKQDQSDYQTFSSLYGPENPRVITARARLEVDRRELSRQILGVKERLTTPDIRSDERIVGLFARQSELNKQIARARRRVIVSRGLSGEYGRLQAEVQFQAAVLQETLTQGARIGLENASARNRMTVIDTAIPPKNGDPGLLKLGLACFILVLLVFCGAVAREYLRLAAGKTPVAAGTSSAANGTGSGPAGVANDAVPPPFAKKP